MSGENKLHWADILVFTITLAISLGIGVFFALSGGRQRTIQEFLMGNNQLRLIPVTLSMTMSYLSGIAVLGTTAEMYEFGTQQIMNLLGHMMSFIFAALLVVPIMYPLKLINSFEYHERRFGSQALRRLLGIVTIAQTMFYTAIAMFSPAIALASVTEIPVWGTVLCTGVLATIYTSIGGMKAVVWTDTFQAIIFFGGLLAVLVLAIDKAGGISKVWQVAGDGGRLIFFNTDLSPSARVTFWNSVFGTLITGTFNKGANQAMMQRYNALPTLRKAQLSLILNIPFLIPELLIGLLGLAVYAYYTQLGCDPLRDGQIYSSNQLFPYFVVDALNIPGFTGLAIAMLFSGALSTVSSNMSSVAAILWKEMEPLFSKKKPYQQAIVTKLLVVAFGILSVALVFLIQELPGHVSQISQAILGGFAGATVGVLLLGLLTPCGTGLGAFIGIACGLVLVVWMNIGQFMANPFRETLPTVDTNCTLAANSTVKPPPVNPDDVFPLYSVSFHWFALIGAGVTFVVGIVASFVTGPQDPSKLDKNLVIPVSNWMCCCLPLRIRKLFWCGIVWDEDEEKEPSDESLDRLGKKNLAYEKEDVKGHVPVPLHTDDKVHKQDISHNSNALLPMEMDSNITYKF